MGDYWTVSSGIANHTGHTCRECRGMIYVNTRICVRDGRKIRLFYHEECFSGESDPRTQSRSSSNGRWEGISSHAPKEKGYGKWWTSLYGYSDRGPKSRVPVMSDKVRSNHRERSPSLQPQSSKEGESSSSSNAFDEPKRRNTYSKAKIGDL